MRLDYIKALAEADFGNLTPVALLFASLEKNAILQALSVDIDSELAYDRSITQAVVESLGVKIRKRKQAQDEQLRRVNQVALALRSFTRGVLGASLNSLDRTVSPIGDPEIRITEGGPDRANAHWYKYEVVQSARSTGKWVNFGEPDYFLKAAFRLANLRLVFVTSFHHIGKELSGVMEATSFAQLEFYEEGNDRSASSEQLFPCSIEPFVITWQTEMDNVKNACRKWLDAGLVIAVKEWGDRI